MAEVGRSHEGTQANSPSDHSRSGQCGNRAEPRKVVKRTPRKMIVCPSVIETELLGATPLGLGDRPRGLGQDQDADAHRKPLLEAAMKFSALTTAISGARPPA